MNNVVIIGGGAAGMMAAYAASFNGAKVTIIEKNEKLGKKMFITGKGRCNVTNACDDEDFFKSVISNPKFMYSSYYGFNNQALMDFVEAHGCQLKIERGNRVFPVSDHSYDVIDAFKKALLEEKVKVLLNTEAVAIKSGSVVTNKGEISYDRLVIATGGSSYKSTGSTGDGYKFANKMGHSLTAIKGGLVPLESDDEDCISLQGLSLKNVSVKVISDGAKKPVYEGFGEMLFTHFGISGPLILTASSYLAKKGSESKTVVLIDLKPALDEKTLDERILKDFDENKNKTFKNSLSKLLPTKLEPIIIKRSGIDENKKVNEIRKDERERLVKLIKNFEISISGFRDINEAIITQGGISTKEINPSTMESKLMQGVFFAGEVIDVDALTGGYNLQIAFSTGYLAGLSAALS